jgi:4-amino-4-deoxy-L-arabinose transferase-like glycosyltransferase
VLAASLLLQVATAGTPDVYDELSGQYASAAWEMVETGDYLVPAIEGVPRLQKPPVVYWLTAPSLALFGRGALGARLPTALATAAVALLTFGIGARLFGRRRGIVSATIFATCLGTLLLAKMIAPEPFFTAGVAGALYAALRVADAPPRGGRWALVAWACAGLACLSKGLHGLAFPAAILGLLAAVSPPSRPALLPLLTLRGVGLFLAVVLPWSLAIEFRFPGYLHDNVFNEQLGHVLDTHFPRDSRSTSVLLFWLQHLVWWFPWALLAPAAVLARGRRRVLPAHPLAALPLVWLVTIGVAVSAAGQRQDYYLFSAFPAFALLVSRAFGPGADDPRVRLTHAVPAALLSLLGVGMVTAWAGGALAGPAASASFEARNSMAGAIAGMSAEEWSRLAPLLLPSGLGLLLGGGAALALTLARGAAARGWLPIGAGCLALLACATVGLDVVAPLFSSRAIAAAIDAAPPAPGALVFFDGPSHQASSLAFYADAPIRWLHDPETEFAVRSRGAGADRFADEETLRARWLAGEPSWLVAEAERVPHWRAWIGDALGPPRAHAGTRLLFASPGLVAAAR